MQIFCSDLIIPKALAKILAFCEAAEYDLIWVSAYSFGEFHEPRAAQARDSAIEISDPREYVKHHCCPVKNQAAAVICCC
jgi:hypothetical protein